MVVVFILSACTSGKTPVESTSETTGSTSEPTSDSRPTWTDSGMGDPDWGAVNAWIEAYKTKIRVAGVCPAEAPTEVIQVDGSMGEARLEVFEPTEVEGQVTYDGGVEFGLTASSVPPQTEYGDENCMTWSYFQPYGLSPGDVLLSTGTDVVDDISLRPLVFVGSKGSVSINMSSIADEHDIYYSQFGQIDQDTTDPHYGEGYAVVCLEELTPVPGLDWGPTTWRGIALVHAELRTGLQYDLFWTIREISCAYAEDGRTYATKYGPTYHPDCDGIDNDLDGEVDEGAADRDGNDVADCQEGLPP